MNDTVYRKDVIDTMEKIMADHPIDGYEDECQLINAMKSLPSAQPEIVRCGECKYLMADGRCYEFADDNIRPSVSDFCSAGVRK